MVSVGGADELSVQKHSGWDRNGLVMSRKTEMDMSARPTSHECWLTQNILHVWHVFAWDMSNAHLSGQRLKRLFDTVDY